MTSWCSDARKDHVFGEQTIRLTVNKIEADTWINHLGIESAADIEYTSAVLDPRVWVGHFHDINYIVTENDQNEVTFNGIDFKSITKYKSETGNGSLGSPPRPAATRVLVQQSVLSGRLAMSFSEYKDLSFDTTRKRRKKNQENLVIDDLATAPKPIEIHKRKDSKPFNEFFMGSSENLVTLMKMMNDHLIIM